VPAGLRDEELEVQVESEANQYIPFALEEVNLDFQVVGPSPSGPDEVEVLIARFTQGKGRRPRSGGRSLGPQSHSDGRRVLRHPGFLRADSAAIPDSGKDRISHWSIWARTS